MEEELKELGLTDSEVKIYLACLSETGTNVKDISLKTGIIRTTSYGLLEGLIKKGFVSEINRGGIKFFRATSPKELINVLDQKKEKIKAIIPELEKIRQAIPSFYNIDFFQGKSGVKIITNDIISKKKEVIKILGAGQEWFKFSEIFSIIYYRKKKEMNVKTKTILSDTFEERNFLKNKDVKNSEIKFLKNIDVTKTAVFIYQDKVAFASYEKDNPRGFIIKDKEFNYSQNVFFDNLWRIAKN